MFEKILSQPEPRRVRTSAPSVSCADDPAISSAACSASGALLLILVLAGRHAAMASTWKVVEAVMVEVWLAEGVVVVESRWWLASPGRAGV